MKGAFYYGISAQCKAGGHGDAGISLLAAGEGPAGGGACPAGGDIGVPGAGRRVLPLQHRQGFADPSVRAVWCTRGGSTAWQLLPLLDYDLIRANPKPLIGFSDVTTLHLAVGQRCGLVTYHGPTANRVFGWREGDGFSWPSLCRALGEWEELAVENPPGEPIVALRPGQAEGRLTGGNLSLVAASLGTPWQVDARGKILFLEDVREGVYALERMLCQLRYAGILDRTAAVVFGPFTSCRNAYREDYGPLELLRDFFAEYPKPVIANVRSAHCMPMVTLPLGACCQVDGGRGALTVFRK